MKDFFAKINQFKQKFSEMSVQDKINNTGEIKVKIPFSKLIFSPFGILTNQFGSLFRLSALFALVLSLVSIILGFAGICFTQYREAYFFCSNSNFLYIIALLVKIFLVSMFLARWSDIAFLKKSYDLKNIFLPSKRDCALTCGVVLFLLLNLTPILSFYLLYMRVPNPDWVVEVFYFACVSVGFLVPFVLMRFYALPAAFLAGQKFPSISYLWQRTKGNNLAIILSLFLVIVVMSFLALYYQRAVSEIEPEYVNWSGTVLDYAYNLIMLMIYSLIMNHCWLQKEFLLGENNGTRTDTAN